MGCPDDADDDDGIPIRPRAHRLCNQPDQWEKRIDEHRPHAPGVGIHAQTVDEPRGQVTTGDGKHRDEVERENEQHARRGIGTVSIDIAHVSRCPKEEEPPHAVGQETPGHHGPCLTVGEAFPNADAFFFLRGRFLGSLPFFRRVLFDIGQLFCIHVLALLGGVIDIHPHAHPNEADGTDKEEGHLPPVIAGQQGNHERSQQRTDLRTAVEHARGKAAVFLREILRRDLDGGGEVSALADGQHTAGGQKEIHTDGGNRPHRVAHHLQRGQAFLGSFEAHQPRARQDAVRGNAAECMQACTGRPKANGPQIAAPRPQLVDDLADEQHADGIHDGETSRNDTIVRVVPPEFGRDEIFPRQRQHLTVHVVDGRGQEEHGTDDPPIAGHP